MGCELALGADDLLYTQLGRPGVEEGYGDREK